MSQNISNFGIGLGLRRAHFDALLTELPKEIEWFEIAPENYLEIGGKIYRDFCELAERIPVLTHSVALSIGSLDPLDFNFLDKLKKFIKKHQIPMHSDHICFSSYKGIQFDDLLPLPFTEEAIKHVSKRIKTVSEILEVPFAVENISYYAGAGHNEMSEGDFIRAIIEEANCLLLLDINNVYVNSVNHGTNAIDFLDELPLEKIPYVHIAGHYRKKKDFILDTHGAKIIDPVWNLLEILIQKQPLNNILIERDNNIPPLPDLIHELNFAKKLVDQNTSIKESHVAP